MSLSTGVHIAPQGHGGHLPHQNYHYRPLSWLHLLILDSGQNLSSQLPLHLLWWQGSLHEQAASTRVPERKVHNDTIITRVNGRFKMYKSKCLTTVTHIQFFGANPVVFRELDVKLEVKVSLLKWVSVLRHSLSLHHSNTACYTQTKKKKVWRYTVTIQTLNALASAIYKLCIIFCDISRIGC